MGNRPRIGVRSSRYRDLPRGSGDLHGSGRRVQILRPILDHFGASPLARVDQAAINAAARKLYPGRSPATLNRQLYTPIAAILNNAHRVGLCEHRMVARPAQPVGRVRWISPSDAERLIAMCSPHLRPLVIFLLGTGARVSEALYLQWPQVELARGHVSFLATKNGTDRGVPLHPRVVAELANLPGREGAVFRRPDGAPYAYRDHAGGQIKRAFATACRRAGIESFRPHDCRHTWATWLYASTRDLAGLMRLGGWRSERMVLRYAHVNVADLAPAIRQLPWGNSGEGEKIAPIFSVVRGG
jgi:integrase